MLYAIEKPWNSAAILHEAGQLCLDRRRHILVLSGGLPEIDLCGMGKSESGMW